MTNREPWLARTLAKTSDIWSRVEHRYQSFTNGPLKWIIGIVMGIVSWYRRRVWTRFARNKEGQMTTRRVSATVALTIFVLWMLPAAVLSVWQAGLMAATYKVEKVYLTNAEEVDPDGEVHSIRGRRTIEGKESETIYFRVRASWMHDWWAFAKRGHFFYPEEVAGVVAPGLNECTVTSYGIRIRALMRGWGIYPDMLDAVCRPMSVAGDGGSADAVPANGSD